MDNENKSNELSENLDTTPKSQEMLSIKFNKEIKEISLDEAAVLAQKGLKFDAVSPMLERLKSLAESEGKSANDYIEELEKKAAISRAQSLVDDCPDKSALIEAIAGMKSRGGDKYIGFDELKTAFPKIDDISKLPEEVVEKANLYGRNIFDEYLRYEFAQKQLNKNCKNNLAVAAGQSIGSQVKKDDGRFDPVSARFLKGLWGN